MVDILAPESLRQLELLQLRARRKFLGTRQGGNVSPKRGHGIEFADYRRYELGDDPRHIDWGVYGRTDRLYVKQFQEEQDFTLYCLIDCSASMFEPASDKKFLMAVQLALGFAYIALSQNERVVIEAAGQKPIGRIVGAGQLKNISERLIEFKPVSADQHDRGINRFLHELNFPGICIVISDFMSPLLRIQDICETLYTHNLETFAVRLLGQHDIDPFHKISGALFVDSETGEELPIAYSEGVMEEYKFHFDKHSKNLHELFNKYQIGTLDWTSDKPALEFFVNKLTGTRYLGN